MNTQIYHRNHFKHYSNRKSLTDVQYMYVKKFHILNVMKIITVIRNNKDEVLN